MTPSKEFVVIKGAPAEPTQTWFCVYPGCSSSPARVLDSEVRPVADSFGSPQWSFAPDGWRRCWYKRYGHSGRAVRHMCPEHAPLLGYGGHLGDAMLDALDVLSSLLQD